MRREKEGREGKKLIVLRSDKLICNELRSFCMTAGETYSEAIERGSLVMVDKGDYHPQRIWRSLSERKPRECK